MTLQKINPLQYITDVDPVAEDVINASGWFQWEYTFVEATEEERGTLAWMLAQGWVVYQSATTRLVGRSNTEITAYQYWLKRRKLQSEQVLNDLIREFTEAYNEGRELNDSRYDELVTLYSVMLDKTEDEMISWISDADNRNTDIEALLALFPDDLSDYTTAVESALTTLGDGREDLINIAFDAKLSLAKSGLISRGMYNTTIWTSVEGGIERERQIALNNIADTLARETIDAQGRVLDAKTRLRIALIDAYARLNDLARDELLVPTEIRNRVMSAMLNFMERRSDEYPGLEGLANIAGQLGYGEASSSAAPS